MYPNRRPRDYRRPPISNFTYISSCVKYLIFVLNFVFWLFGGLLIGIGLFAFVEKWQVTGWVKIDTFYDVILNISLVMIIMGIIVFIVSFAGCIGALRENTCLLNFYSLCLLIFFLLEMGVAVVGFVFPHTMESVLEENFTDKIIHTYRDDLDLQNFIDFAQQEFQCCGLSTEGFHDWAKNEYFNCSSPSVEHCGVPYSCCINSTDISSRLVNIMCGYGVQNLSVAEANKKVWTSGCIEIVRSWAERNLYTIGGIALGNSPIPVTCDISCENVGKPNRTAKNLGRIFIHGPETEGILLLAKIIESEAPAGLSLQRNLYCT